MRRAAALFALLGLAVATLLLAREGLPAVLGAFASAGLGVVWASLFHAVPMALNARAWQLLVGRGGGQRSLALFGWLVWVREAVNGLLPVARVGGEVATARLLVRRGVRAPAAVASLVVDVTVALVTQLAFTLGGVALLAAHRPDDPLARALARALALAVPVVLAVLAVQRRGSVAAVARLGRRLAGSWLGALLPDGRRLDRALAAVWAHRGRVLRCAGWQLAGWGAGAGELWIFLACAGQAPRALDALLVEALVQAASSAAFVVPAALGVQEGAFLAAGAAIGLSPELALALALSRRARDVIVFVPGLVAWQLSEARGLLASRAG